MRNAAVLVPLFFVAGCAALGGGECASPDLRAQGFRDGSTGRGAASPDLEPHACATDPASAAGLALYLDGWEEGVDAYCAPASGFALAASGSEYNGVCNGESAADFASAFRLGEEVRATEAEAAAARMAASDAQRDLWEARRRLAALELSMRDPAVSSADRRLKSIEAKALAAAIAEEEASAAKLERASGEAEARLSALRSRVAEARLAWSAGRAQETASNER